MRRPFPIYMNLAEKKLPDRIDSERVYLRCYRYTDSGWYYEMALRNKAHLLKFESGNAIFCIHSAEESEAMMDHFEDIGEKRKELYFGVFLQGTGEFVGQVFVGLSNPDPGQLSCSLGLFADVAHEGKGYMTESVRAVLHFIFGVLQAQRAILECDPANIRSARLAERCGFSKEDLPSTPTASADSLRFVLTAAQARRFAVAPPKYQYR